MRFADIVGHGAVKEILRRAADRDRVPHAYLFHGPEGVGKRSLALALYSYLVCHEPVDGDACGACTPCRQVDEGTFVDIHRPPPDKGVLKIGTMRDVMSRLFFEPMVGPWKFLLVDDAHTLTHEAANAALKTLEEPPPRSLFVLVTSTPDILPRTVLSRCFQVPFGPLATEDVVGLLVGRHNMDEALARDAAVLSRGSVQRALQLAEGEALGERVDFIQGFLSLAGCGPDEKLAFSEGVASSREESAVYMDLIESVLSDLLLAWAGLPDDTFTNADMAVPLRTFASRVGMERLQEMVRAYHEWDATRRYRPYTRSAVDRIVLAL
ncbi:MAG: DNA polymerase III subunit delta' [Deltaproteobacteria bacterium]|nr:DNA polymerase III subunit delta' [Deltaproteobacteria bacterium]